MVVCYVDIFYAPMLPTPSTEVLIGDTPDIPCINELPLLGLPFVVGTDELFMFVSAYLNL